MQIVNCKNHTDGVIKTVHITLTYVIIELVMKTGNMTNNWYYYDVIKQY